MAYVIGHTCIDVKDGDCVNVCPVDCIYEGGRMFYIQPDECINCELCVGVCPVEAIFHEDDLPSGWERFVAINRDFFGTDVTGLGEPGGATGVEPSAQDHPTVAEWPADEQ